MRHGIAGMLLAAAALASGCGGSDEPTKPTFEYRVRVTAPPGVSVLVRGCPSCAETDGKRIADGFELFWDEKRSLPRVYELEVNGKRSACPPLKAVQLGPGEVASFIKWNLTVDATGNCVRV